MFSKITSFFSFNNSFCINVVMSHYFYYIHYSFHVFTNLFIFCLIIGFLWCLSLITPQPKVLRIIVYLWQRTFIWPHMGLSPAPLWRPTSKSDRPGPAFASLAFLFCLIMKPHKNEALPGSHQFQSQHLELFPKLLNQSLGHDCPTVE